MAEARASNGLDKTFKINDKFEQNESNANIEGEKPKKGKSTIEGCQWCADFTHAGKGNERQLSEHQLRRHPEELAKERGRQVDYLQCSLCARSFAVKHDLSRHMRNTHGPKDKVCDLCGYATTSKKILKDHRTRHHFTEESTLKMFSCSFCEKHF